MDDLAGIEFAAASVMMGLAIGVALLPWKRRLYHGHEWWVIWGALWPFMLLYAIWFGLLAYHDAWTTYLAERDYLRRSKGR